MQYDIKDMTDGKLDGKMVWICDYRYTDFANKPIRHVEPMQVLVRSNAQTTKKIYYSLSHFVPLDKKGNPINSKVLSPVDNTGFRSLSGTPVSIFDNEAECRAAYVKMSEEILARIQQWFAQEKQRYDDIVCSVQDGINKNTA